MNKTKYDNFYHHNRNYGCRYKDIIYRGFRTVILENEKILATIVVDRGTDIIEFLYKPLDIDFLWKGPQVLDTRNNNPVTKEHSTGAFLDVYEGGWQELFPSMNLPSNYKGAELGYHGEILYVPWDYQVLVDDPGEVKIKFYVRLTRTPFFVEKIVSLKSMSTSLEFEETILNEGDEEIKFTWGHHPVFGKPFLDENCVIDVPGDSSGHTYEVDYSGNSIIELDRDFDWPMAKGKKGKDIDLSQILSQDAKTAFNVYISNIKEGWYGITNLEKNLGFGMKWDEKIFKYLMFWVVYRGFYSFPFYGRTYSIGIEPWSSVPGEIEEAIKLKQELTLQPGEILSSKYKAIAYESKSRIEGFDENNKPIYPK